MPISIKDIEFMKEVARYFRSTKTEENITGSIRETANRFEINRNKVRKILITMGEIESPITEACLEYRRQGMSINEISQILGVSAATVSTALPYEDKFDNSLDPSSHATDVRNYRAYEKEQRKRQEKNRNEMDNKANQKLVNENQPVLKEWENDIKMSYKESYHRPHRNTWEEIEGIKDDFLSILKQNEPEEYQQLIERFNDDKRKQERDEKEILKLSEKKKLTDKEKKRLETLMYRNGFFKGALNDRNRNELEKISGNKLPPEPMGVLRLHLELYDEYPYEETTEVFKKFGQLKCGDNISRDIIVPNDIPLYALHYVIQRAFGWQNSHLHQFELPKDRFCLATNDNASIWSCMVGILFRSPIMDDADEFWADDYNGGSFKNWLRKKYTGPYISQCYGEGIISCQEDMMQLDMQEEYYILYVNSYNEKTNRYDGKEFVNDVVPVFDYEGNRNTKPKPWMGKNISYRVEKAKFEQIPADGLKYLFERNPMALLERLPICSVLAAGKNKLPDGCSDDERNYIDKQMVSSGSEIFIKVKKYIDSIIDKQIDSPEVQALPSPITDVLIYSYDFGDNWKIKITASENCSDLVESGRITQTSLDKANIKCREVYRPVLIARDGEMLIDDVGGISGFADFLRGINPDLERMNKEDKKEAKQEKSELLAWAKGLGWHKDDSTDINLL